MSKTSHADTAEAIITKLGGEANVRQVRHCATRLRIVVADDAKVDEKALGAVRGVISVVKAGGQTQVVIGNDVVGVYDAVITKYPKFSEDSKDAADAAAPKGNIVNRFIEVVSSIFVPTLGVLAGTGLVKAFLSLATQLNWMSSESTTFIILNTAADAFFYALPVMLAYTSARRFKADVITAMTLGATLVYPALVGLMAGDAPVTFLGIPVQKFTYTSSVIPIILAVWALSHLERVLNRVIPVIVRKFIVPPISLIVMLPLMLIVVGPVAMFLANQLASAISALFDFNPWIAGAVVGGIQQAIVIFGLHWGLIPVMIQEVSTNGQSLILAPIVAAVLGQAAAALGVMLKVRNQEMRVLAGSASLSGFLAGITEPAIYGVNLRYRTPFLAGCAGGAVGGALISGGGVAATAFVFPSLLGLPAFMTIGHTAMLFLGCAASVVVALVLTLVLPINEALGESAAEELEGAVDEAVTPELTGGAVHAPVAGEVVPAAQLRDQVFASGAMGATLGVRPVDGQIVSPVAGTVLTAMDSGHAYGIRSDGGVEVLVHVGIDTVQLNGQHFQRVVSVGDTVRVGDLLGTADLAALAAAGYDTTVIVAVTNTPEFESVDTTDAATVRAGGLLLSATAASAQHATTAAALV